MRTFLIVTTLVLACTAVHGATIHVPVDYPLIQDAIHAAQAGDTIEVAAGTYHENLLIGKSINLVGEDRDTTIIDGNNLDTVINVAADHFAISGFTVCNSADGWPYSGLLLNLSSHHAVTDNLFIDNYISVHISETSQVDITDNLFQDAGRYSIAAFGWSTPSSEIHISTNEFKSQNKKIFLGDTQDSSVTDNMFGLYTAGSYEAVIGENVTNLSITGNKLVQSGAFYINEGSNVTISDNDCTFNLWGGIKLYSVDMADVERNHLTASGTAVLLDTCSNVLINKNTMHARVSGDSSHHVTISDNTMDVDEEGVNVGGSNSEHYLITGNTITNPAHMGIKLEGDYSQVSGNTITHSGGPGIVLEGDMNEVYENTIISCVDTGLRVIGDGNKIYHNNFFSNTPNAGNQLISTNNLWEDGYPSGGNYWSDYDGVDIDGDGIGDTSYLIHYGDEDRYPLMNPTIPVPTNVKNMDTGETFFTIQAAMDDADTLNGHTILVPAGNYLEQVTFKKSLRLQGENAATTILDGAMHSACVFFEAPGCTLSGFTIHNGNPYIDGAVNIISNHNLFTGNILEHCDLALQIKNSKHNTVSGNYFRQNDNFAISLDAAESNTISDNRIMAPDGQGISIYENSHQNWVTGNHIEDSTHAIIIYRSDENMISGNTLVNTTNTGLTVWDSEKNVIQGNIFQNIAWYGLYFGPLCVGNIAFHNNFINITKDNIQDKDAGTRNCFEAGYPMGGNYYDDYSGQDLFSGPGQDQPGSDGLIDKAYAFPDNQQDRYPLVNHHAGLAVDVRSISAATGGLVQFTLDSGPHHAGRNYVILGSITGVLPGTYIPNVYANTLPLNWDSFTNLMIPALNSPVFDRFLGQLDMNGAADATLNTTGLVPPDAVGITLAFAYTLYDLFDIVSNPVGIVIVP